MKRLTREEFNDRLMAIQRASKIFIESGLTNNISTAFEIYQKVFADRERQLFIDVHTADHRYGNIMDEFERPRCPDCDAIMWFSFFDEANVKDGIRCMLSCSNPKCDTVLYSEDGIAEWMKNLRRRQDGPIEAEKGK